MTGYWDLLNLLKIGEVITLNYLLSFLEGIITFISPCLLPMLPIYISYFAGQKTQDQKSKTLSNALGFVLGFTSIFIALGAFAGAMGGLLIKYNNLINLLGGLLIISFGLNYLGIIRLPLLWTARHMDLPTHNLSFFSALFFGMIFSISWTPCVGAFLGSALMLAASQGGGFTGILMLLCYALGLGIPFIASALLIDRLKTTFDFIKRHYRVINLISGSLLVILGLFMATGLLGRLLALLTY
jgi:cytochrome c-type biogenesis protein